jgi:alkylation response protein AidB-like acyl-CoA dehydrogenase
LAESLARAKEWQAKKADAGFAAITWPRKWGGRGGSPIEQVIYNQEEANYAVPRGAFEIGLGMCIPTMMAYGTPEQLERHVRPALRGEEVWCQLFSEPAAGSDLAGLRTRAERSGDDWIINGQKIWTSGAHFADFGIIVTRTDPGVPKHQGLTFFFLSMKSPGIEVRRIKQISGTSNFNEVFFTDVRVPRPPDGRVCAGTRMACARGDLVIQFRKGTDIALSCTSARGPCRTTTPL